MAGSVREIDIDNCRQRPSHVLLKYGAVNSLSVNKQPSSFQRIQTPKYDIVYRHDLVQRFTGIPKVRPLKQPAIAELIIKFATVVIIF